MNTLAPVKPQTIGRCDSTRCVSTLTLAFAADPPTRWIWPDADVFLAAWGRFVMAFGGKAFESGTAHLIERDGRCACALWLPPGESPDEQALGELFEQTVAPDRRGELFEVFEQMAGYHPAEPHWHLPLIGVDPAAQGRGLGSELLHRVLAESDKARLPAYLEATSPRNVRLYERHGFEAIGRINVSTCPTITPMLRRPAGW